MSIELTPGQKSLGGALLNLVPHHFDEGVDKQNKYFHDIGDLSNSFSDETLYVVGQHIREIAAARLIKCHLRIPEVIKLCQIAQTMEDEINRVFCRKDA